MRTLGSIVDCDGFVGDRDVGTQWLYKYNALNRMMQGVD